MNQYYPERHHPIYFLQDALTEAGVPAEFHRDERSKGLWALDIGGKLVVWMIDIRWPHEREAHELNARQLQDEGALLMAAQKPDADYFECQWLPLAASPGYGPPKKRPTAIFDLAFVGYVRDVQRESLLLDLNRKYTLAVSEGLFGPEAVQSYHQARLGVNIPTRYGQAFTYDSANMRAFEVLATGTPLVTPDEPYLVELGIVHNETAYLYRNGIELCGVVEAALADDNRATVGKAGVELVRERHTYAHRAKQVMEWL